jgi:hypothetical protein
VSLAALREDDPLLAEVIDRAVDHDRWLDQVAHTGYCHHPVRLSGRIRQADKETGEIREVYNTDNEADATLLKACGNRRESRCPSCAARKRGDTYQLVLAGLRGGKGVPDTVALHPKLFVTYTAPSFGAVHSRRTRGHRLLHCHPRQGNPRCPHGRPAACWQLHLEGDSRLGEPLCAECFDYEGQVIWNALCPELWRRTRIDIPRCLAQVMGLKSAEIERAVRFDYCKQAELQLRGAIHFHVVMRLDARPPRDDPKLVTPPPSEFSPEAFAEAVRMAHERVEAPHPKISSDRPAGFVRWGKEIDIRNISADGPGELTDEAVAFYVAKYATKNTEAMKGLDHVLSEVEVECLMSRPHVVRLVRTSWLMGNRRSLEDLKLQKYAYQFGFGGHWSTKSRRYSTTFGALQAARPEYVRRKKVKDGVPLDAWGRPESEEAVVVLREWRYVGSGYLSDGEKWLALSAAAWAREQREIAREEIRSMARVA